MVGSGGDGGGGGGSGHATSATKSMSATALNPPHGRIVFWHASLAVTIGPADGGMGCVLSPSIAHSAGVSLISHCPVLKEAAKFRVWNVSEKRLSLHPATRM